MSKERHIISISNRKGTMMVIDIETVPNKKNRIGNPYKISTTKHVRLDRSKIIEQEEKEYNKRKR